MCKTDPYVLHVDLIFQSTFFQKLVVSLKWKLYRILSPSRQGLSFNLSFIKIDEAEFKAIHPAFFLLKWFLF